MATFKYNYASLQFASGAWNWTALAVNAALVNANYSALITDQFMTAIPPSAIVVRDIALTGLAARPNGVCAGNIPQFNSLVSAVPVLALVLYVKGANDAASPLIYYSADGLGFPFIGQGFNYLVAYDQTAGGWFQV